MYLFYLIALYTYPVNVYIHTALLPQEGRFHTVPYLCSMLDISTNIAAYRILYVLIRRYCEHDDHVAKQS